MVRILNFGINLNLDKPGCLIVKTEGCGDSCYVSGYSQNVSIFYSVGVEVHIGDVR
jgi:hypothetical protein